MKFGSLVDQSDLYFSADMYNLYDIDRLRTDTEVVVVP